MGILQASILEWVAMPSSEGSSPPRVRTQVLPHCRQILYCLRSPLYSYTIICICIFSTLQFSSGQSLSRVRLFATPWTACSMPGLPVHHQLPEFTQTHVHWVVMPSNHLILYRPLLLPSVFPSIRVFSDESALRTRWPKYWSFSFNISPSNEHLGLISFRMDWLDLLAVQGTLKSLLQHHSSKASVLRCSAFFIVQLSHPYMTTGKTLIKV